MIDYSFSIAYAFIKKILGQKSDEHTTEEESKVMGKIFTQDLKDLEEAWTLMEKLCSHDAVLETNPEYLAETIAPEETVMLVAIQIDGPDFSGLVNMAYPVRTLESVVGKLESAGKAAA